MVKFSGEKIVNQLKWPSLIIVTILISWFLYKSYNSEKQRIKKEVGLLFINSIRGIEGDFFNKLIINRSLADTNIISSIAGKKDSLKIFTFIAHPNQDEKEVVTNDWKSNDRDSLKVIVRKNLDFIQGNESSTSLSETDGVISVVFKSTIDNLHHGDTNFLHQVNHGAALEKSLQTRFDQNLQSAGMHISYDLNVVKDTIRESKNENIVGVYKDLASREKYQVNLKNNSTLALMAIWPEILLAFLLLTFLSLAFYSMSQTIKNERNLMESKNDFIQNMTHELKTPISTVKVALEALNEYDGLNDAVRREEYLSISRVELDRLTWLVDRVLSISKIDQDLPSPQKESIDLAEMIQQIILTLQLQLDRKDIKIQFNNEGSDSMISGDRQWISGIVYNLLDNAIKYSDKTDPHINISINKKEGLINLIVEDNGPGISPEYQAKIFEKFYRIPQGNIHTIKGHGLGLAFVKRLVDEMGGKINVFSEVGKGAAFNISLPV